MLKILIVIWILLNGLFGFMGISAISRTWKKLAFLSLFSLVLIVGGFLFVESLSRPKPYHMEWRQGKGQVIASILNTNKDIWLWVAWPDINEPRAYRLDWNESLVEKLEIAEGRERIGLELEWESDPWRALVDGPIYNLRKPKLPEPKPPLYTEPALDSN